MPTEKTPQEKSLEDLQAKAAAAEGKASKFDAVHAAVGETLASDPAQLKLLADAGGAYRQSLVETIITAEREAKRLGDDAGSVELATKDYERLTTATLERMAKAADAAIAKGGTVAGGAPGAETTKAPPATGETKGGFLGAQA